MQYYNGFAMSWEMRKLFIGVFDKYDRKPLLSTKKRTPH